MNIKLIIAFSLISSGILASQKDGQISQKLQAEINRNVSSLNVGLQMLETHNIVVNEYQTRQVKKNPSPTRREQAIADSKQFANADERARSIFIVDNDKIYSPTIDQWLDLNQLQHTVLSGKTIIFNIFPSLDDQSAVGREIVHACNTIKEMSGHGARIMINTDLRCGVEAALKSFFDENSWKRVSMPEIIPVKQDTAFTPARILFGGSIAAIVILLCYLKWGK